MERRKVVAKRPRSSSVRTESIPSVIAKMKRQRPRDVKQIDEVSDDFLKQADGGGISDNEIQIALLSAFPKPITSVRKSVNKRGVGVKRS